MDKVQNIGLRTIFGTMKIIPTAEMGKTAGEQLESRRQAKCLIHAENMNRMPDHPLHQKLKDPTHTHTTPPPPPKKKADWN